MSLSEDWAFKIEAKETYRKLTIYVSGSLNWDAFAIISSIIFKSYNQGIYSFKFDLKELSQCHSSGVLPIIAIVNFYRDTGISFSISLPRSQKLKNRFYNYNWAHFISDDIDLSDKRNLHSTGVMRFASGDELNDCARRAMELALRAVRFAPGQREGLEWALGEIGDNVITHSNSQYGWMEARFMETGGVSFNIIDTGSGIPEVLRQAYPDASDPEALSLAIQKGITSGEGQGNGLAGAYNIARSGGGKLFVNSGHGQLRYISGVLSNSRVRIPFGGTYIAFSLPSNATVNIQTALWGFDVTTYAHYEFNPDDEDTIIIKISDEVMNTNTRSSGEELLNVIQNLYSEKGGKSLILDFEGITSIGSGFCDEVFGKLFIERGAIGFANSLKFVNLSDTVRGTIEEVIKQRVSKNYLASKS